MGTAACEYCDSAADFDHAEGRQGRHGSDVRTVDCDGDVADGGAGKQPRVQVPSDDTADGDEQQPHWGADGDRVWGGRGVRDQGYSDETCLALAEEMGWLDNLVPIVDAIPGSLARLLWEWLHAAVQHRPEEE